ncbi:class I SAM-dependent methyltransferase [Sphingobium sp. WCS2017Hpa-17]|uniref:class I SAM-dependent methyltransferase n=1 Tax=Sphingobium sp. WCS2017Hpa-17 TaxID=3073638 RepID=UPI00288A6245|nr:class I SAM-dependent methyltransferase [Sphingobium sp. WCS2017Hpa-17]
MTQPQTAPAARTDAAQWTGANGDVWAAEWQRTDRSFAPLTAELDRAISESMGGRAIAVADIGSGAGGTSIAAAGTHDSAQVTGFDISPALVAVAQERAAGLPNCRFVAGPAEQRIGEAGPFDLIVSRHGVMFFDDPVDAFTRLRAAARPGAGLIFSCFRAPSLNAWARELMAVLPGGGAKPAGYEPGPFAFADADFVRVLLAEAGWTDVAARPVDFAYRAGEGSDPVADAVAFFSRIGPAARALKLAPPAQRGAIFAATEAVCRARLVGDVVEFPAAAWIWSARNPD